MATARAPCVELQNWVTSQKVCPFLLTVNCSQLYFLHIFTLFEAQLLHLIIFVTFYYFMSSNVDFGRGVLETSVSPLFHLTD